MGAESSKQQLGQIGSPVKTDLPKKKTQLQRKKTATEPVGGFVSVSRLRAAFAAHSVAGPTLPEPALGESVSDLLLGSNIDSAVFVSKMKAEFASYMPNTPWPADGLLVEDFEQLFVRAWAALHQAGEPDLRLDADRGHVFVVQSDLRKLAADAVVLPAGHYLRPTPAWFPVDDPEAREVLQNLLEELRGSQEPPEPEGFIRAIPGWPVRRGACFCVNMDATRGASPTAPHYDPTRSALTESGEQPLFKMLVALEWIHRMVVLYLRTALKFLQDNNRKPINNRARYLLALPLLGTGFAGARRYSGHLVREILPVLYGFANDSDVDIALASIEPSQYAVIQAERRRFHKIQSQVWSKLSPELKEKADHLAEFAHRDQLTLFLGAGVSIGAGLPSWSGLLRKLAVRAGLSARECSAAAAIPFLDQALLLAKRLGGTARLAELIVEECKSPVFGITHALLARLPVDQIVTTNYDVLFEEAVRATGEQIATLPYQAANHAGAQKWILKMHGCVNHPRDIVLTREDFIRYEAKRAALAGIVQALLITKHMLFVGFSLQDENFHRIVDAVRRAVEDNHKGRPFGTALFLLNEEFLGELWGADLDLISMHSLPLGQAPVAADWAESGRRLEIFLDYLGSVASSHNSHFLLDDKFEGCLQPADLALKTHVVHFIQNFPEEAKSSAFYEDLVQTLVGRFGSVQAVDPLRQTGNTGLLWGELLSRIQPK